MILSRGLRQQGTLRAVFASSTESLPFRATQRRHLHGIPQINHGELFEKEGVPQLLSAAGFRVAWTEYQGFLVNKVNALTGGTDDENSLMKTILLKYARQADRASLFNHASMAHNNTFFFNTLSPQMVPIPDRLEEQINLSFSSIASFRTTFLATANAMFGPGFVWLVKLNDPNPNYAKLASTPGSGTLAILTTYIAGSPYPGAHFRLQPTDMATQTTGVYAGQSPQAFAMGMGGNLRAGTFGRYSGQGTATGPGGQDLDVLLGVNTWEHVYLHDYGVGGKRWYLEAWWERVDWEAVNANMGSVGLRPRTGAGTGQYF